MPSYHGITRCGGKEACGHEDDGDDVVEAVANMLVIETDGKEKKRPVSTDMVVVLPAPL